MRFRNILCLLLSCVLLCGLFAGCNAETEPTVTACQHNYTSLESAGVFADKTVTYTCSLCAHSYSETIAAATNSIKILAIGNSFNNNSSSLLYELAKAGGAEEIVIGCLWIGGSSLEQHANNIKSGAKAYEYRKNSTGKWVVKQGYNFLQGLQDEDWDYICINQRSLLAGQPDAFELGLTDVATYIRENMPQNCQLWFNMTWAYDADYTANVDFGKYYNYDPMTMYEAVRDTCRTVVMDTGLFEGLVPCGTTMQNMRSSWAAGLITQDGYHASTHLGCYALGLTWLATWTDIDVAALEYFPRMGTKWGLPYEEALREIAKEAVLNTMANPYELTQSKFAEKPEFEAKH